MRVDKCMLRLIFGGVAAAGVAFYLSFLKKKVRLGSVIWSKSWLTELSTFWPGQAFSLQIEKKLFDKTSPYQHVQVFDTGSHWGRVLVLDGVIQCTEKDESAYQEMMAHVPLMTHPNPKTVLVVGGGDGGVLREIAKHELVEEIHICELDEVVIDACKAHIPSMACGYDDPRVSVHILDGFEFMQNHENKFDVIIVDSSDPVGPAEILFKMPFYKAAAAALKPDGVMVSQGESMWLHLDVIREVMSFAADIFSITEYANVSVPSYPCGGIGVLCCSKSSSSMRCSEPQMDTARLSDLIPQCKFYNRDVHAAAFVLPNFVKDGIKKIE